MALIPASVATALLGGELAAEQLPDLEEREALIREAVALKAGPDGFPRWNQPYGTGGRVTEARGAPLPYKLTAHSEHGSPSDMLATIGPHSHFGAFLREDVREIGHWFRLGKLEEQLEGGTAGAQARRRGAPAGCQATGAFGKVQWARPWTELPRGCADYRILEASPPDE